uniref:Uncharacterized protein n=1 Tax=Sphaerodactylus townsendi TaxID=933632 RepID=A0ACB8FLP7_9SAUR
MEVPRNLRAPVLFRDRGPGWFINVRYWRVLVGATDLSKPGPDAQVFTIKMLADHEQYSPIGQLNDIAVIELNQSVACNDYVQLACLPDGSVNMPALSHCYFSGWSTTDTKRYVKKPEILQEVKVNLLEVGACNSSRWVNKRIQDYNVCVMAEKGGKENCQGGPVGTLLDHWNRQLGQRLHQREDDRGLRLHKTLLRLDPEKNQGDAAATATAQARGSAAPELDPPFGQADPHPCEKTCHLVQTQAELQLGAPELRAHAPAPAKVEAANWATKRVLWQLGLVAF